MSQIEDSAILLSPTDIRALAAQLNIRPTKTLGQNFVHDANTVRRIISRANLQPGAQVIEVGPGLGSLTLGLLDHGCAVTAVEIDEVLAQQLPLTVAARRPELAKNLTLITADALQLRELPTAPTALVANLPYNVAVPVILNFLELFGSIETGLVMVQAEVADRLAAPPGSKTYGIPSVKAAWSAQMRRDITISRNVFWPVPRVDSALVAWQRIEPPNCKASREQVFAVIDAAFSQRRKTLRSALANWAGGAVAAEAILRKADIDPSLRGERLNIHQFAAIADAALD